MAVTETEGVARMDWNSCDKCGKPIKKGQRFASDVKQGRGYWHVDCKGQKTAPLKPVKEEVIDVPAKEKPVRSKKTEKVKEKVQSDERRLCVVCNRRSVPTRADQTCSKCRKAAKDKRRK